MRSRTITAFSALTICSALLLSGCSSAPAEKEQKPAEQTIIREEQPVEVNAVENSDAFYKEISDFVDLSAFEKDWLQLAPMEGLDENSASAVWFAVVEADKAIDISNKIIATDGWASVKDSAPQTPEEQEAQQGKVIEEDPLDMSGVIYLTDGNSMSVTAVLDSSQEQKIVQYMFSTTRISS